MKRKVNCSSDDYDFYTIPFPLKVFMYKKRNKYISSQLEKLHPCFSDDCSFDSHLRLEKSGLKADVVVMQKYRVAEYKLLNKRLFVKELKHVQFFADKKKIKLFWIFAAAAVVFVSLIVFLPGRSQTKSDRAQTQQELPPQKSDSSASTEELLSAGFLAPNLLSHVSNINGSISDFSWSYDGFIETASISLGGIFPEQLETFDPAIKLSSVIFENLKPFLAVSFSSKKINSNSFVEQHLSNQKNTIRQLIIQNGFTILEETITPFGLKITLPPDQLKELILILQYFQDNNICIQTISINSTQAAIKVYIEFSKTVFEDQNELYESLIKNINLFESPDFQSGSGEQNATVQLQKTAEKPSLKKLGQIVKPDGSVIQYFKDHNGKITVR